MTKQISYVPVTLLAFFLCVSAATASPVCDKEFLAHDSTYFSEQGGYITSDLTTRLTKAGKDLKTPLDLPELPFETPSKWLEPVTADTECTWVFRVPQQAISTIQFE
jgi:hypothetical protein